MIKKLIVFLSCTMNSSFIYAEDLSLEQAIQRALKQNYQLSAAKEKAQASESSYKASFGKYLPKVELEGKYTHLNDDIKIDLGSIRTAIIQSNAGTASALANPTVGATVASRLEASLPKFEVEAQKANYSNAALTVFQPIYTGGKITANKNAKYEAFQISNIQVSDTQESLSADIAQAYFAIRLSEKDVEVRKELVDGLLAHQKISQNLLLQNQITKAAKMQTDVKLIDAQSELAKSTEQLSLAKKVLANLLNQNLQDIQNIHLTTEMNIAKKIEDLDYFQSKAQSGNKMLQITTHNVNMLGNKYEATQADFFPNIFAFGRYELYKKDLTLLEPKWYVGVGLKMNLFSGGENFNELAAIQSEKLSAQNLRLSAQQTIELAVQKYYTDLHVAFDRYYALAPAVSLAKESLRLNTLSYQNGVARTVDVSDAYITLAGVQLAEYKALYDYNTALFQLNKLVGLGLSSTQEYSNL